jgi:hypothetical protein
LKYSADRMVRSAYLPTSIDPFLFHQAANGVWLTDHVPPGYVSGWPGQGRT